MAYEAFKQHSIAPIGTDMRLHSGGCMEFVRHERGENTPDKNWCTIALVKVNCLDSLLPVIRK